MITRKLIPFYAIAAAFLIVIIPYGSAATHEIVRHNIELAVDSENQDRYDSVVNLADPSTAITNPDTWQPAPQGIWIGASTEESLFQFDVVMAPTNVFQVHSHVRFNSTQIMNGGSTTIIRSPISSEGVEHMRLRVWALSTPEWELRHPGSEYPFLEGNHVLAASVEIDMTDNSITEGGDQWTVDGRTYIRLYGPLYSGVDYVFSWAAIYKPDSRPAIYLTGQDVANDNITDTQIGVYSRLIPDQPYSQTYRWKIDPGISFDFQQGLGSGGVYAQSFYMGVGDSISFLVPGGYVGGAPSYYHTVMIPWATADGKIKAKVTVEWGSGSSWSPAWEDSRTEWNGYILACSDEPVPEVVRPFYRVTVTFLSAERVNWIFLDSPSADFSQAHYYNNAIVTTGGIEHKIQSRLYASYQRSVGEVFMPSMDPADFPAMPEPKINDRVDWTGTIIGVAMIVAGAALIPVGIGVPMLAGGILVAGGVSLLILDEIAHNKGYSGVGEYLGGTFSNALDNLWESLEGVGNFLRAVGEGIWDGLVWFADAVTEYGSVLLGLLIIAVALALFFAPIYTQLKLWGIVWRMAEGDVQAAAAQAQDLASQASGVMSKFRRH